MPPSTHDHQEKILDPLLNFGQGYPESLRGGWGIERCLPPKGLCQSNNRHRSQTIFFFFLLVEIFQSFFFESVDFFIQTHNLPSPIGDTSERQRTLVVFLKFFFIELRRLSPPYVVFILFFCIFFF